MATAATIEDKGAFLAGFDEFMASAEAARSPWLGGVRRAALARFAQLGIPTTRNEDWKYTNLSPLAHLSFKQAHSLPAMPPARLSDYTFSEVRGCLLVFMNGRLCDGLSNITCASQATCARSLAHALESERGLVEPRLGSLADFERNAFTALNSAYLTDGAFIHLPSGTSPDGIIHILYLSSGRSGPLVSNPRNLIVLGDNCQASVVESYVGFGSEVYLTNAVTEILLGKDSVLEHYKLQRESDSAFHIGSTHVRQERGSNYVSHSISLGGNVVRNDLRTVLDGEGCEATLNGLYVARGRSHVDNSTLIDHARSHCTSRELYKGILDEKATGAFTGKIIVRPDSQKTNSKQTNRNLLLSEDALVNTRPQLEIFADDVKCTHGATIGRIGDEELFYMRSRGIDRESARRLLTYAFASDILGAMKLKPVQCQIDLDLLGRLAHAHE